MMSCHSWKTGFGWPSPIGGERMLELHNPSFIVYKRGSIVFVTLKYDKQSLLVAGEELEEKASRNKQKPKHTFVQKETVVHIP